MKRRFHRAALIAALALTAHVPTWAAPGAQTGPSNAAGAETVMRMESPDSPGLVIVAYGHRDENAPSGDLEVLASLARSGQARPLRQTSNGSYGASLWYYGEERIWFAALSQQDKLWRVFKTVDDQRAESVYRDFAKTSATLAATELKRVKLESERAHAAELLERQQNRARALQTDLALAGEQDRMASNYQQAQLSAMSTLRTERDAAQAQLRTLRTRVDDLQRQADQSVPATP